MGRYRFVVSTDHDVSAENLEEALHAFNELRKKGLVPRPSTVRRIEIQDEDRGFVPVDRPLRAGDLPRHENAEAQPLM